MTVEVVTEITIMAGRGGVGIRRRPDERAPVVRQHRLRRVAYVPGGTRRFEGRVRRSLPRRRLAYTYELTDVVMGERLVMRTTEGPFPMETSYAWSASGPDATRMTLRNRGQPAGFSRLVSTISVHGDAARQQQGPATVEGDPRGRCPTERVAACPPLGMVSPWGGSLPYAPPVVGLESREQSGYSSRADPDVRNDVNDSAAPVGNRHLGVAVAGFGWMGRACAGVRACGITSRAAADAKVHRHRGGRSGPCGIGRGPVRLRHDDARLA